MKRSTFVLAGIVIILGLVVVLVLQRPGEQSSTTDVRGSFVPIDSLNTDRIEITAPGRAVALARHNGEWVLTAPVTGRADQGAVAGFLHLLKRINVRGTVSTRPEKQAVFQVDSSGTAVRLFAGSAVSTAFILGKSGANPAESYARNASSNEVVLVEGVYAGEVNKPLREWRDRSMLNIPRERITEVRYRYGDTTFALMFQDSAWTVDGRSANTEKVNGLLNALSAFQGDDVVDNVSTPVPETSAQITVAGIDIRFALEKERGSYLAQTSATPQWYRVESWHAGQVLLRKGSLLTPAP